MNKRKFISILILCILIPAMIISCFFLIKGKQYFIVSIMTVLLSMVPFFMSLERKKLQVRELVITASVIAIAVASRGAFFFLPQIKPTCAILIIAAIAFGAEFGFVSGALTMLLSNFIYGQGMWTPFQMLGMGLTVFFCAMIFHSDKKKNRFVTAVICGIICFVVYGIIVDLGSVFMMAASLNLKSIISIYASGLYFNLVHAICTTVIIALIQPIITEKLDRIKIKYGVFTEKNI